MRPSTQRAFGCALILRGRRLSSANRITSSCARQAEGRHDPPAVITLAMFRNWRLSYSARVESSHGQVLGIPDALTPDSTPTPGRSRNEGIGDYVKPRV